MGLLYEEPNDLEDLRAFRHEPGARLSDDPRCSFRLRTISSDLSSFGNQKFDGLVSTEMSQLQIKSLSDLSLKKPEKVKLTKNWFKKSNDLAKMSRI